jgi:hypothetical protein
MINYTDLKAPDFNIHGLFQKFGSHSKELSAQPSVNGLKHSMELIGYGEITEKSYYDFPGDRLMYKEYSLDQRRILIVHGAFTRHAYGGNLGYRYEVKVYSNKQNSIQYGGGYGAPGTIEIRYSTVFSPWGFENVYFDETLVSKVCAVVKENFFN